MPEERPTPETRDAWERQVLEPFVAKRPERADLFVTGSGQPVERLYTADDLEAQDEARELGFPGSYPYTRGVYPTMYRGRLWTMRQYAGFGTAAESNQRYRYLLERGQTGLSVAFDLCTQIGYDSDHALARGEVGKVGVAISTLEDMETLLADIPLDQVSTSMTINSTAAILLAMYLAVARRRGIAWEKLRGTVQNDILKEYIARGTYIFPPQPSMRVITDMFAFCAREVPGWNPISISGYHIREAGSTAAQEIAFTLADGVAYVQAALDAGLDVDRFAGRLSFFFNAHNDLLEEVAKFRAARRMWARIMRERFGARHPSSWALRFHAQTSGVSLTAQQPHNNVARVTIQALAAVLGGAQSLHTNAMDEALALPTEEAVRIALRTQQVVAYESGIGNTIDPLGGSYAVESLTNSLEAEAGALIERIDAMGGMVRAVESGFVQREIQESAYRMQREIESGERAIVGVNRFQEEEGTKIPILRVDPQLEREQVERLRAFRAARSGDALRRALHALKRAAESGENLMPPIIEAVDRGVTLGEISDILRQVFGEYRESVTV
ncbi:MAG: methylmalonyl-CoA mutase family protein [Candidatus Latescibacterota bacterium]|nr:MAG: methylmalonyl-CoA mutase family protein [Candidatus Latescibacterota bacterium]